MTDEKKAIANICKECSSYDFCIKNNQLHCAETVAYLDGLAEGRKTQWHDLRKNPNDLPKNKGEYRVYIYDSGIKKNRTVNLEFLGCNWVALVDVIAWAELPKFEE